MNGPLPIEDVSFGAPNCWYYYPALTTDADSNMVMVFNRSCSDSAAQPEYAGIRFTTRIDGGDLQPSEGLKAGEANYVKTYESSRNRWGDYSGAAVDPADPSSIWIFSEYAASPEDTWGTWFGQVRFTDTPPVALAQTVATTEDTPVAITLTGSDPGGDPLTFIIMSLPGRGDLSEGDTSVQTAPHALIGDTVTYTPNAGFGDVDSFDFKVNDSTSDSDSANIRLIVAPPGADRIITKTGDTNDGVCDADCSLREAIATANSGDAVYVPSGTYTLTSGSELSIDKSLTLTGAGSGDTVIQAATASVVSLSRVLHVTTGEVSILAVTIRHGNTSDVSGGGAILNQGTLSLANSRVSNNTVSQTNGGGGIQNSGTLSLVRSTVNNNATSGGGNGGGIRNLGTLSLTDSTVSGNTTNGGGGGIINFNLLTLTNSVISDNSAPSGGGIRNLGTATLGSSTVSGNSGNDGGGIQNFGSLTLTNSTISNNSALGGLGGGIYNDGGTITLTSSTISSNSAFRGGGVSLDAGGVTLINTIVANNTASSSSQPDCNRFTSLGHNLIGNNSGCSFDASMGDLVNVEPLLGSLQDNGGPTFTHALLPSSPAIDGGDNNAAPDTDQRGVPRPLDGDADSTATSDIGAYEFAPPVAIIDTTGSGNEGALISFNGSQSTAGIFADQIEAYSWDFGDGVTGDGPLVSHTFDDDGLYNVTLTVTDDSGLSGSEEQTMTINNVPPTITGVFADPSPTDAGMPTTIIITATDATGDILELLYSFDCDEDAVFEIAPQASSSAECTFPDGPVSVTVNVQVADQDGGVTPGSVQVQVTNLPPVITAITLNPPVLTEAGGDTDVIVDATDVPGDGPLMYSFDCRDDGVFEVGPLETNLATCTYPPGTATYTVRVKVQDKDGDFATDSVQVLVGVDPNNWTAQIFVETLQGLGVDFGPRTFGVHPDCTSSYDLGFAGDVPCDAGRSVFSDPEFKSFFHYPQNPDLAPSQDETRLLTSRIEPADPAESVLHWRFRVELERTAGRENQTDEIVLTWDISTIPPEFETVLLIDHNTLPANQVINMGRVGEYRFTAPAGVESFTRDLTVVVTRSLVQVIPLVQDLNVVSLTIEPLNRNRAAIFSINETFFSDPDTTAFIRDVAIWFTNADKPIGQRSAGIFPIDFLGPPFVPFSGEIEPGLGHLVDVAFNDAVVIIPGTPLTELEDNSRGP